MADKISTVPSSYQGRGGNSKIWFGRDRDKIHGRDQVHYHGFNLIKPKVWGKCKSLWSNVYLIGDAQQADKYTKTTKGILNYIKGSFNKDKH